MELREEIKLLKFQKHVMVLRLKEIFLKYIKDEKMLIERKRSIIGVVVEIRQYGETIANKNFSNFFNDKDIEFIMNYS